MGGGGGYGVSASTSSSAAANTQFGNVQQGDNSTSSGFGKNLPLIILGAFGLAFMGGLVWLVSRN